MSNNQTKEYLEMNHFPMKRIGYIQIFMTN